MTADSAEVRNWVDFPPARPTVSEPEDPEAIEAGFTHSAYDPYSVAGASAFEAGGPADLMPPCSVLAELTGQALDAGLERLTDDELIGVLRAARRVLSWQTAVELAAVAELVARRDTQKQDFGPRPAERASAELAVALTLTSRSADLLMELATGVERLPDVAAALARGDIDRARAAVFVEELACLPWLRACWIAAQHMPIAAELTTTQLRNRLRRAVLAEDPDAARRRQREARRDARVETWPERSGNTGMEARELPSAAALLADRHISALAKALKAAGMPGTFDQIRAEVFLALLTGQPPDSLLPDRLADTVGDGVARPTRFTSPADDAGTTGQAGTGGGGGLSWPSGPLGTVHLTMPISSWLGLTGSPGQIAGYGPADAWTCGELASSMASRPGTRYCLTLATPDGRPLGHACAKTPPPGPMSPAEPARAGPAPPGPEPPGPQPPQPGPAEPEPAWPTAVRTWLASMKIEWLASGECDHSRETAAYRPGRLLDHLLKVRNPTCTTPRCSRPAERCDIDHVIPYDQGGRTCECNCHPACRRHHRCKGSEGWHLDMPAPGVLAWRLPHGRTYLTIASPYPV